ARAVVLARVGPVDVVPQDVGAEAVDQLAQLGGGEIREGGVVAAQREQLVVRGQRREVGDVPVVGAGVVQPQAQALRANGLGELGEQVPAGAAAGGGEGGGGAVPEAEAVMVLRGGHDVAGAGAGGEAGDPARRVLGGVPVVGEVLVGVAEAVDLLVARLRGAVQAHGVRVPLGVRVAGVGGLGGHVAAIQHIGPGGQRLQAPVH